MGRIFGNGDKDISFLEQLFACLTAFFVTILEFFFPKEVVED